MKRERITYSKEFKIKAAELSNAKGNMVHVAEELNINKDTLKRWKKEYAEGRWNKVGSMERSAEQEDNMRLRKALKDAQEERDILKKALSIFSANDR